jgi:hypothetical protein
MTVLVLAGLILGSIGMFLWAVLFSRIVFDRYVKRHHLDVWRRLRDGRRAPMLSTDATYEMAVFRSRVNDDLGDRRLRSMKLTSRKLYWCAAGLWLLAVLSLVVLKLTE